MVGLYCRRFTWPFSVTNLQRGPQIENRSHEPDLSTAFPRARSIPTVGGIMAHICFGTDRDIIRPRSSKAHLVRIRHHR
jgi:hypothetical protein